MSSLLRRKLSTRQPGTATPPFFWNKPPTQWEPSLDERTGGVGRGRVCLKIGGEGRTRGWQCCTECVSVLGVKQGSEASWSDGGLAGRHCWETEQRPVCPTLWMKIMLHCTRLPLSSEGVGHLFCGYYECRVCVWVKPNEEVFACFSTQGMRGGLLFFSYGNHRINHSVM